MYLFFYVAFPFLCFSQSKTINSGWQYSENKTHWQTVNIPHTWNAKDAFDDEAGYRRGLGFYEKQIFVSSKEKEQIFIIWDICLSDVVSNTGWGNIKRRREIHSRMDTATRIGYSLFIF